MGNTHSNHSRHFHASCPNKMFQTLLGLNCSTSRIRHSSKKPWSWFLLVEAVIRSQDHLYTICTFLYVQFCLKASQQTTVKYTNACTHTHTHTMHIDRSMHVACVLCIFVYMYICTYRITHAYIEIELFSSTSFKHLEIISFLPFFSPFVFLVCLLAVILCLFPSFLYFSSLITISLLVVKRKSLRIFLIQNLYTSFLH